jgi:hypothetical protein
MPIKGGPARGNLVIEFSIIDWVTVAAEQAAPELAGELFDAVFFSLPRKPTDTVCAELELKHVVALSKRSHDSELLVSVACIPQKEAKMTRKSLKAKSHLIHWAGQIALSCASSRTWGECSCSSFSSFALSSQVKERVSLVLSRSWSCLAVCPACPNTSILRLQHLQQEQQQQQIREHKESLEEALN